MGQAGRDRLSEGAVAVSALERISGEPHVYKVSASVPADRRSLLQRLSGELVLPERSETQALQCKLACIVSWMQSQRIEVPLRALMMLSDVEPVREHAARALVQKCQERQSQCGAVTDDTIVVDTKTALRLAISECELLTAPVTARSVSSVDDAGRNPGPSARARDWLTYGVALDVPVPGAITIIYKKPKVRADRRLTPSGYHVGFYVRSGGTSVTLLGGNQSDQVRESTFKGYEIKGFRWPS